MRLYEEKTDRKFRFLEDFPDYIESHPYKPGEEEEEPKATETKFFGSVVLHQIARVEWTTVTITEETEKVSSSGEVETSEETVTYYKEIPGELGGMLEYEANLSQEGDCWVEQGCYVLGGARVFGDAVIKGRAEIGDSASVYDEAEVKGPVGIGGSAKVYDTAKVKGNQRLAVYDSAVVCGASEIKDNAKVYGYSKVEGRVEKKGVISGNARVYGHSLVLGNVKDNAEVYGRAVVKGWVDEEAQVGGSAVVGANGHVLGGVKFLRGEVYGYLGGENGIAAWPVFMVDAQSSIILKKEKNQPRDEEDSLPSKEKDKLKDRETKKYDGKIKSLKVLHGSIVEGCEFEGDVVLKWCHANKCKIVDSVLGLNNNRFHYTMYGASHTFMYINRELNSTECNFEGCILAYGDYANSTMKNCDIDRTVDSRYDVGGAQSVVGSVLENCTLLPWNMSIRNCNMKCVSAGETFISEKDISNCVILQTKGPELFFNDIYHHFKGWYIDREYKKIIKPNEYSTILGKNRWGGYHGVGSMPGIAFYVGKFESIAEYCYAESDYTIPEKFAEEYKYLIDEMNEVREKRVEWYNETMQNLNKIRDDAIKQGNWNGVIDRLIEYVKNIVSAVSFWSLSEVSFNTFKEAVEHVINSYDGVSYDPYIYYGLPEEADSIKAYEEKYGIPFGKLYNTWAWY